MSGRRMIGMAAAAALGLGLFAGGSMAANPCAKDCAKAKVACIKRAKDAKKACTLDKKACRDAFKVAKTACIDSFKAKKPGCASDKTNIEVCSPSGAFLLD